MPAEKVRRPARRRNLRNGKTLWEAMARPPLPRKRLETSVDYDAVVIGAGITGALTALTLVNAGFKIAILDRRKPGTGSTAASTALIQFDIDTPLLHLAEKIGAAKARRVYQRAERAVADLHELLRKNRIASGWRDRGALYLAGNVMGHRALQDEADARSEIGLPSRFLTGAEVQSTFRIEATGAVLSEHAAELNPLQTARGCLARAVKLGAGFSYPWNVATISSDKSGVTLESADGNTIRCKKCIVATGYEVIEGLPKSSFDIVSSWVIATKPLKPSQLWPSRCLIWQAADPYLYLRTTIDRRIIVGGEDSNLKKPDVREAAIASKSDTLLRKTKELLAQPDLEVDYAWAGAFADSPNGLPVIRQLDGLPNVFAILGCGGNGITFSVIAAQMAAAWMRGKADRDYALFNGE